MIRIPSGPRFFEGTPGRRSCRNCLPSANDLVVEKLSMSAFEGTPLAYALRDCGLIGIAVCGTALEICIEPTVRHATDLGFIPIVITDACGTGSSAAGARALETMRFVGGAIVTDTDSFCASLQRVERR